ncbi:hypothetical protein FG379_003226 [Cryptosporidium bovis]|uniref:uncharacterized protein n=1 Tax=Cryptosporidium bovis TaxID=310047 RepID=UPI00351A94D6|nr:hypothetical protein FG379_003226 [Cryptosporidium bovis]
MESYRFEKYSKIILPLLILLWSAPLFENYSPKVVDFLAVKNEAKSKLTFKRYINKVTSIGLSECNNYFEDNTLHDSLNVSFLELFKKKKNPQREQEKELKRQNKELKKNQKKQDKKDEDDIKKLGKQQRVSSNDIKKKIKELKKQLKLMRNSGNNGVTLMGLFQSTGGFGATGDAGAATGSTNGVAGLSPMSSGGQQNMNPIGAQSMADSDGDGIPNSAEMSGMGGAMGGMGGASTTPLTKEEKKQQKEHDKLDFKKLEEQLVSSGMNKSDAKKKVKKEKKKLKKLRKTQPRATLFTMNSQVTAGVIEGIGQGSMVDAMGMTSTTPLTKEEKKQQKEQDKLDFKKLEEQLVSSGMNKSDAKKKVKKEKKKLKKLRKTQPRATLFTMNNQAAGVMGAIGSAGVMAGAVGSSIGLQQGMQPLDLNAVGMKLSDLEARIVKLEKKNKMRKAQILSLTEYVNKMATVVKRLSVSSSSSGGTLGPSFDDDDDI